LGCPSSWGGPEQEEKKKRKNDKKAFMGLNSLKILLGKPFGCRQRTKISILLFLNLKKIPRHFIDKIRPSF
jgi:hypothetical protein